MNSINQVLDGFKSLSDSLLNDLQEFLEPFAEVLPDAQFRKTLRQFVPGMLAARSPHITKAAGRMRRIWVALRRTWPSGFTA